MRLLSLLGWRLRLARAGLRGPGAWRRALPVAGGAFLGLALFTVYRALFDALRLEGPSPAAPLVLLGLLHALLVLSLLRDTAGAVGHLFLSRDAGFLLASPLGPRSIVFVKAGEALADGLGFPLVVIWPGLLAYGVAAGAPPGYYAATVLALLAILGSTIGVGFLVSLWLGPRLPAGRVREGLGLASALLLLAVWLALLGWSRSAGNAEDGLPAAAPWIVELLRTRWLPSAAAAAGLEALAGGRLAWTHALGALVPPVALWGALFVASPGYAEAWGRAGIARRPRPPRRREPPSVPAPARGDRERVAHRPGRGVLGLALAFARRDARLYRREPSLAADVAVLAVMTAFLPVVLAPGAASLGAGVTVFAIAAVLFVAVELGFDFGSRSLPLERSALARVRAAPWSARRHGWARALACAALALPGLGFVAAVGALATDADAWVVSLAVVAALGLLTASVPAGLLAGVYFGQSDWRHPRQMLAVGGRWVLAGLLLLLGLGFWVSLGVTGLWLRDVREGSGALLGLGGACAALVLGFAVGGVALERAVRGLGRGDGRLG